MEAIRYHVLHETRYEYDSAVSLSQQQLHLSPRSRLATDRGTADRHRTPAILAARRTGRLRQSGDLDRLSRAA